MNKEEILKSQKSAREISDDCQNSERILKQAKQIIDNFHSALKDVEKEAPESKVERDECERAEKVGEEPDKEFRKILFENAPRTKGECIEAEKGKWL